jgi:hypothetical protein
MFKNIKETIGAKFSHFSKTSTKICPWWGGRASLELCSSLQKLHFTALNF